MEEMMKKAYIALLGRSSWALINSYYAVLKNDCYTPDIVYVFVEERDKEKLDTVISAIKILNEEFDVEAEVKTHVLGDAIFLSIGKEVFKIMNDLVKNGFSIALDITSGKKTLVAASLLSANNFISPKCNVINHIFYLSVDDPLEAKPFMMIPSSVQVLRDFKDDNRVEGLAV
jgi:hypothetical protein